MSLKVAIVCLLVVSTVSAGVLPLATTTFVRTPSLDSAIVRSERLGGNFAYSTVEGHAYAAVSPVVHSVATPVAVSYAAHPVVLPHAAVAAPLVHTNVLF
uniref:Putative neuropeptide like 3-like protein n=1 Tax=Panstrongylus lignarius TaxID=156445 RepID=A0A224Y382_9HEMI